MRRTLQWVDPAEPLPQTSQALTEAEGANGLLAAGRDLSADRLIEAYSRGIFPWFSRGEPVLWWSPSPRMVLMLSEFRVSKSLRKHAGRKLRDCSFEIKTNQNFEQVMLQCAAPRPSQPTSWISPPMIQAYLDLHHKGLAHSIEVHQSGSLVGGLYCVALGAMVYGESMFTREPNASKLALACLVAWMRRHGGLVIDCQQQTSHLASLGARQIDREDFEAHVSRLTPLRPLPWDSSPPRAEVLKDLI